MGDGRTGTGSDRSGGGRSGRGRRVERWLLACFAAGLLVLAGVGVLTARQVAQAGGRTEAVLHAFRVEVAADEARQLAEQLENARRGFLASGDPLALRSWQGAAAGLPVALARLDALLTEPDQHRQLADLRRRLAAVAAQHAATNRLAAAGRLDAALALYRAQASPQLFRPLRAAFAGLQRAERAHVAERAALRRTALRRYYALLAAAGVLVTALVVAAFAVALRFLRDLDRSEGRLRRLNDTLEEQVATRTADLASANEEVGRFAYIVSHDLRSPLVNVMGFTAELAAAAEPLGRLVDRVEAEAPQLLDPAARAAAREDVPEAIDFIRTSTRKMDGLINAILRLSREGRRVLTPEPLDLAALADAAVAAIRHVVDDRGVAVTVARPMPAITTDRLALDQILSNLVENATKYGQPGRPGRVAVSAGAAPGGRVWIEVADNGRGIAPRDHGRVFDLFRRAGAQDQPGEGIGLAHARALSHRLGGTITVRSAAGEGATFRVELPATLAVAGQPPIPPAQEASA